MGEVKRPTRDSPRERGRGHTTMERRKFLIGAGALASGSAAAVGTGAFTSVTADRTVNISTSEDSDAFLAFETGSATNSAYVSENDNGTLSLDLDADAGAGGSGVNKEGTTQINDIFKIRNQGSQDVVVYVDPNSISSSDRTTSSGLGIDPQAANRPNGDYTNDPDSIADGVADDQISLTGLYSDPPYEYSAYNDEGNTADAIEEFVLEPGEAFDFGMYVNGGSADSAETINSDITIVAEAGPVPDSFTGQES